MSAQAYGVRRTSAALDLSDTSRRLASISGLVHFPDRARRPVEPPATKAQKARPMSASYRDCARVPVRKDLPIWIFSDTSRRLASISGLVHFPSRARRPAEPPTTKA